MGCGALFLTDTTGSSVTFGSNNLYASSATGTYGVSLGGNVWKLNGESFDALTFETSNLYASNGLSNAVVPIPPAVWLFGPALGLMGWVRRKFSH